MVRSEAAALRASPLKVKEVCAKDVAVRGVALVLTKRCPARVQQWQRAFVQLARRCQASSTMPPSMRGP